MEDPDRAAKAPLNILLVEDNETDVKITLRAFSRGKIKSNVYTASNGEEAMDYVLNRGHFSDPKKFPQPDFILMDLKMPKVGGLEALRNMKGDPKVKHLPVAILTSSTNEEDVRKSYEYGAVTFIPKPVSYEDFSAVVDCFNSYWHRVAKLPPGTTRPF